MHITTEGSGSPVGKETKKKTLETEAIMEALIQYYEAAGFADAYHSMLKHLPENELLALYQTMDQKDFHTP